MGWNKLTRAEEKVIVYRGTEPPFTGEYEDNFRKGTYEYLSRKPHAFRQGTNANAYQERTYCVNCDQVPQSAIISQ